MKCKKWLWNGVWSDMMTEATYIKYEKGPSVNFCLKTFPRFDITESSK